MGASQSGKVQQSAGVAVRQGVCRKARLPRVNRLNLATHGRVAPAGSGGAGGAAAMG